MNRVNKKMNMYELLNAASYFTKERKDRESRGGVSKFSCFPPKVQYAIASNTKTIEDAIRPFIEIREEMSTNIKNRYFDEEHSILDQIDGKDVRKVKPEYMTDYSKDIGEFNKKLTEFMMEKIDVEFFNVDMESLIENLPDDSDIGMEDIEVLSVFEK